MQIEYDPQANALYIRLRAGEVEDTVEADRYIFVDVDNEGVPLGIEILFAGKLLAQDDLTSVTFSIGQPAHKLGETFVAA